MDHPQVKDLFPQDAIDRARGLMKTVKSIGAYSDSRGVASIRQEVADFIERRDGYAIANVQSLPGLGL
jgi:alanine transaminase